MRPIDLSSVLADAVRTFAARMPVIELPPDAYSSMRYPRFPALMRFAVRRYAVPGFGNLFTMYTRAMGGMMQLLTLVFTPNLGAAVPLLLIDAMAMGKKRAVFVEYYDLTSDGANCPALADAAARADDLPDYPEKPAWYIAERAPYSRIKGGNDDARLIAMLLNSVAAYAETCKQKTAPVPGNLTRLSAFIERMVREGNPSSATMQRVLGADGAEAFFRTHIMPKTYTERA